MNDEFGEMSGAAHFSRRSGSAFSSLAKASHTAELSGEADGADVYGELLYEERVEGVCTSVPPLHIV